MQLEDLRRELTSVGQLQPATDSMNRKASTADIEITEVVHDSRMAAPGTLFCAVPGLTVDGHDFIPAAVAQGASAVLVQRPVDAAAPLLITDHVRRTMAHSAAIVHGRPSRELAVFGITGTNGKTTTTKLLSSIVTSTGRSCSVIGTLDGVHTTPESTDLQRQLRSLANQQTDVVALEVSSHALDQFRVEATEFAVAAFSNLTPDHLDYHHDMQSYFEAKKQLFDGRASIEIINVDDPWGLRLADERPDAIRVSLRDVEIIDESLAGTRFTWHGLDAWVPLPGRMNVANALMAAASARALGLDDVEIVAGLAAAESVPGRMQTVPVSPGAEGSRPTVVVDYSHTPDSIEVALATLRAVAPNAQLFIVFGCGGDRDRQKRPLMGRAAEKGADRVYVTSDNPRSEDPQAIIDDALAGFDSLATVVVEPDRKAAIERAIIDAGPADVVLIAGKGHEKTQTIGSDVLPFDDVSIAAHMLEADTE